MSRAPSGSLAAPRGTCRGCGEFLVRDAESKRPKWHCSNMFCEKNNREPVKFGNVVVLAKEKDR